MSTLAFGLTLLVVGMAGTLLALWLLTLLIGGLTALFPPTPAATPAATPAPALANPPLAATATTITEPVPAQVLAVITAAIHAHYGPKLHIVAVSPIQDSGWSREGRRAILSSHRIR
jgi:sodium pump decarboxylase gamma subunit